jgi:NAD(P)-dependent dehydrogenase (short-subunit alcohol dehydrogenase family)
MVEDLRLDGRVVLVTGGSSGIGLATVRRAQALGAVVASLDVSPASGDVFSVVCDVRDPIATASAVARVAAEVGPLSALVNNAGVIQKGTIDDVTTDSWERTLGVNLTGVFNCVRSALPYLRGTRGASIVNLSSVGGRLRSLNGDIAYASSKAGVIAFTRHAAAELASDGIRVNCVCPGAVETPMYHAIADPDARLVLESRVPLGRAGRPEEIASVICFLLSDAASYMTGQIVDVNGGML